MKQLFFLIFFCFLLLSIQAQEKRVLQPADVYHLSYIENPQVSPDGKWIAYTLTKADSVKNTYTSDIWMISWDGKEQIQLTYTKADESEAQWSPDGKYLSFLSARKMPEEDDDDNVHHAQLWLLNRSGGEAKKITNIQGEINEYAWSPDGKKIVLAIKDADMADTLKDKPRPPYVITRYRFKEDVTGYLDNRRQHLYLLNIETETIDTLTQGNFDEGQPAFSPNGNQIVFVSNRTENSDRNENTDLWLIDAKPNATLTQLTQWPGADEQPQWSPDGSQIAYLQSSSKENFTMYGHPVLAVVSVNNKKISLLSEGLDRPVLNPRWNKEGNNIYALVENNRQQNIVRFNAETKQHETIMEGDSVYAAIELNKATGNWAVALTHPYMPLELYALEANQLRRLTHVNDSFLAHIQLPNITGFRSKSKDGTTVSGILYKPHNATSSPLPLILFIHGGPVAQDDYSFDLYRSILASGGYAVAAVNYRGSSGRGIDYIRSIYGDWGNKEVIDIIGAANYLIQQGIVDFSKMGIAGWSYGGILTNYTIATDSRFKAACSGAGSSLQLSIYGVDQYINQYETELQAPWKNLQKWIQLSYPFFHVTRIKTPTLFMASEKDFNVPSLGAEQMYQALRSIGVPTELVIYPNQYHELTVPGYEADRLQRYLNWFGKYLLNKEE